MAMPMLGAHQSIAGGYYRAVEIAAEYECDTVQLFTKNSNQWAAKPITPAEAKRFRDALVEYGIVHPLSHASYLINLGSPDDVLWRRSIGAMIEELSRAHTLGIPWVVVHPGAAKEASREEAVERVVTALDQIGRETRKLDAHILLETTAGQGTTLGADLAELAEMIDRPKCTKRLGICIDTAHMFAAGYAFDPKLRYDKTMMALQTHIGFDRIKAIHLNDSKRPLGSRVDRHQHIGAGEIGLPSFRRLLNDPRLIDIPMYLETPKVENDRGESMDTVNLRTLRKLVRRRRA